MVIDDWEHNSSANAENELISNYQCNIATYSWSIKLKKIN